MFDLDKIEEDWKKSSSPLSEEEIIKIYQSENATLSYYDKKLDEYVKEVNRIYHEYDPYKNMSDLQKEFKIMFETEQEREENNALLKKLMN